MQRFILITVAIAMSLTATATDWPEFRGPWGNGWVTQPGASDTLGLPTTWSETENIRWKTEIPYKGWSTPVTGNGRIWLTTATEDGHEYYGIALDADTGEIVFNEKLFTSDNPEPLSNNVNCYASPSAVLEGDRAYLHFGTYGTACLDAQTGKTIWKRTDINCRHYRGPGSSPILHDGLLILTMDGVDVQYMIALNAATGETVWRTDRTTEWNDLDDNGVPKREGDFRKAYSTPIIATVNNEEILISSASSAAFGYDPKTGKELWRLPHIGFTTAVSPVFDGTHAFVATGQGQAQLLAIPVDEKGVVPDSEVAWKYEGRDAPHTPSPIIVDGHLYIVSDRGTLTCMDPATGAELWAERLGGNFIASPIYADGHIYLFNLQGKAILIKPGPTYQPIAENTLDDGLMASPATYENDLIIRTRTHLYRIE